MAIYDYQGNAIELAYDSQGNAIEFAYDINGNIVYTSGLNVIKVMTYNVGQWYTGGGTIVPADKDADYYALQNGILQRANADILFINEYRDSFSESGRTAFSVLSPYYPYIETRYGAINSYVGRAICSKYPLSNYTTHNYTNGSTNYYYDSVDVIIDDVPITLVVTHLMVNPEEDRYLQAQELLAYLETLDTFISAGDYNTGISPTDGNDNVESTAYAHYVKLFKDAGFHMANFNTNGFLTTYSDKTYEGATGWDGDLDNIITSADINVVSASVDRAKLIDKIYDKTDHMPLIATLQIN